ncbi:MAG: hypothetical protein P8N52_02980 [Crocinitomicaceae bacterium]|nr:hypothetical protein [Crocinitomicaceae bacterium]MDG1777269.1 hypothetical protein [Crocinitomicaceae bacterium]
MKLTSVNALVINILSDMKLTGVDMMSNVVKTAKFKLSQHKAEGQYSDLSVFQVAKLMDTIKKGKEVGSVQNTPIYFSLN